MNSGRQFGFAELSTACFIFNFHITKKKPSVKAKQKVLIAIKEKDYTTITMLNTQTCTQKTIIHKILQINTSYLWYQTSIQPREQIYTICCSECGYLTLSYWQTP